MPQPAQRGEPIRVVVPTQKVDNTLNLEQVLLSISQGAAKAAKASGATEASGATKAARDVDNRLNTLSKLAQELASEIAAVKKLDPSVERRIRGAAPQQVHRFGDAGGDVAGQ